MWRYWWVGRGQSGVMVQLDRMMKRLSDQRLGKLAKNWRVHEEEKRRGVWAGHCPLWAQDRRDFWTPLPLNYPSTAVHPSLLGTLDTLTSAAFCCSCSFNPSKSPDKFGRGNDRLYTGLIYCSRLIANFLQPHPGHTSPCLCNYLVLCKIYDWYIKDDSVKAVECYLVLHVLMWNA